MSGSYRDPELDLSGLTYEQAHQYVSTYFKTLRQLEMDYEAKLKEILTWEKRQELARARKEAQLEAASAQKIKQLREAAAVMKADRVELEGKVEHLKLALKTKLPGAPPMTNAKVLVEQFEQILGPDAALDARFAREAKTQAVEDELALLKAKLKKG